MKGYFINVVEKKHEVVDVEDNLDTFYLLINCQTLDIVERQINGNKYAIVLDDEGALKPNKIMSGLGCNEVLYGNS